MRSRRMNGLRVRAAGTGLSGRPRPGAFGFTLIELLVVIAIIVLLISILLPTLDRAKELTRLAKCRSNLHNYGVGAQAFAVEHDGFYPGALHSNEWASTIFAGVRLGEDVFHWEDENGNKRAYGGGGYPVGGDQEFDMRRDLPFGECPDHRAWRRYGTSLTTYQEYGIVPGTLGCPSTEEHLTPFYNNWHGAWLRSDYLFVGGCESNTTSTGVADMPGWIGNSATNYAWNHDSSVPPAAAKLRGTGGSEAVLGMDLVKMKMGGGTSTRWNHESRVSPDRPGQQHLVWGDGSVSTRQDGYYEEELSPSNFSINSLQHASPNENHFYYWSQ